MTLTAVAGAVTWSASAEAAPTAYSIWPASTVPASPSNPDSSVELGVRFRASATGWVTGIRYYKSAANTGVHTGTLWSWSGTALAKVTFAGESTTGWQQATLPAAVKLAVNTDYVASYRAPQGGYAADTGTLSSSRPATSYALTATQGTYSYGTAVPKSNWNNANYFVDVAFTTTAPAPAPSATTTGPTWPAPPSATSTIRPPATTPPPVQVGFPSADNTGVPAGVALTPSGSITVNTAGTVIDARDINGTVNINASNVTLKNSRINGSGYSIIRIADNATNVTISDVEINGQGLSGTSNSGGIIGPATVLRANIYGVENGLVPGSGSLIRDSYIHALNAPGAPHIDGIQIDGGLSNITIEHNTIDMREWSQTSTVMIDNYFGPISAMTVNNNRLLGAGYTVYSDGQFNGGSITGVAFTNNHLGIGIWGYSLIRNNTVTWTGNVDDTTGAAI